MTGTTGLITEPGHVNKNVTADDADLIFIGRELLRERCWAPRRNMNSTQNLRGLHRRGYAIKRRVK